MAGLAGVGLVGGGFGFPKGRHVRGDMGPAKPTVEVNERVHMGRCVGRGTIHSHAECNIKRKYRYLLLLFFFFFFFFIIIKLQ